VAAVELIPPGTRLMGPAAAVVVVTVAAAVVAAAGTTVIQGPALREARVVPRA
jgi:hypothetical protein